MLGCNVTRASVMLVEVFSDREQRRILQHHRHKEPSVRVQRASVLSISNEVEVQQDDVLHEVHNDDHQVGQHEL